MKELQAEMAWNHWRHTQIMVKLQRRGRKLGIALIIFNSLCVLSYTYSWFTSPHGIYLFLALLWVGITALNSLSLYRDIRDYRAAKQENEAAADTYYQLSDPRFATQRDRARKLKRIL